MKKDITRLILKNKFVDQGAEFYSKYKHITPIVSFAAGFLFDVFTLGRIDTVKDNIIISFYILLMGILIVLINFNKENLLSNPRLNQYAKWYPSAFQFLLGGIFSKYVVYYIQSASIGKHWLFIVFLAAVLVGNEFGKNKYSSLTFQTILYFFSSFSFFIFSIPILTGHFSDLIFLISGFLSLAHILLVLYFIFSKIKTYDFGRFKKIGIQLLAIYLFFVLLYFFNWIPPIPLSTKHMGIYNHVKKQNQSYTLRFEEGAWYEPFKQSNDIVHYAPSDTVFCFSSIFAPTDMNAIIHHNWQVFSKKKDDWQTTDNRSFKISGGRGKGYRGYTYKKNATPGRWRVRVLTDEKQVLAIVNFQVEAVKDKSQIEYEVIHQ
jgi:hypothetical protein